MDQELGMLDQLSIVGCGGDALFNNSENVYKKNYREVKFWKSDFLTILKYAQRIIE